MQVSTLLPGLTSGFLLYLLQETKGFENGECHTYTFVDCDEAILVRLSDETN